MENENEGMQRSQVFNMDDSNKEEQQKKEIHGDSNETINQTIDFERIAGYQSHDADYSYNSLQKLQNFAIKNHKDRVYFGQIFNKIKHGKGVLLYFNGRTYEGLWENDRRHGYGFEKFSSSSMYVGYYVNGKPQGQGTYKWSNGEQYEGEWVNGTKHGFGLWIGSKGDKYEGEWKGGKPDGMGKHSWINGDVYEGQFKECLKQGYGIEKFGNGDQYKGFYSNGKPEGKGEYYWNNGAVFKGLFQNGLRCGFGEYRSPNYCYKGFYQNDRKFGYGEYLYSDGRLFKGTFYNDVKDGEGVLIMQDQSQIQQIWHQGRLIKEGGDSLCEDQSPVKSAAVSFIQRPPRLPTTQSLTSRPGQQFQTPQKEFYPLMNLTMQSTTRSGVPSVIRKQSAPRPQTNQGQKQIKERPDFVLKVGTTQNTFMSNTGLRGIKPIRTYSIDRRNNNNTLNKTVEQPIRQQFYRQASKSPGFKINQ